MVLTLVLFGWSRNERSPKKGIDTLLVVVVFNFIGIVEMREARRRALTLTSNPCRNRILERRNERSPKKGIDTIIRISILSGSEGRNERSSKKGIDTHKS